MNPALASKRLIIYAAFAALATAGVMSCGSVTAAPDGGTGGAAGSQSGGTSGTAGEGGTKAAGGTTGAAGTSAGGGGGVGGLGGLGGLGGRADGGTDGPLACRVDSNDCPTDSTCACGGAGPVGTCTCHKNCSDVNACPAAEPMCGCPSTTGGVRFCVNACFCTCN